MRSRLLPLLLLFAIVFNIAHASITSTEEHCMHEDIGEYILKQDQGIECGDLCDFHHLFHFTAIIMAPIELFGAPFYTAQSHAEELNYSPPFQETANKPPIA